MRILINGRFLIPGKLEGIGLYTFEIVKHLAGARPKDHFIICVDRSSAMQFTFGPNVTFELIRPPARHPLLFYWWFEIGIPKAFRKHQADLFFSPDGFCSLQKSVRKTLMVIHDLAYLHYPRQVSPFVLWYYKFFTPRFIEKADFIITVSNATNDDLNTHFPGAKSKSMVIYNGVRSSAHDDLEDCGDSEWKERIANKPYFMTLGSIHPRKNLKTVLNAFAIFRKNKAQDAKLLVVGRMAWKTSDIRNAYENHPNKEQIYFTGYLCDSEMFDALQGCRALIYISLFEGFGLPIVEAMSKGVPVITSNRSSMKEIAGNAAILVNPVEPQEVAEAMAELDTNDKLRASLINYGKQRAELFSWHRSTSQTWKVMHELLSF